MAREQDDLPRSLSAGMQERHDLKPAGKIEKRSDFVENHEARRLCESARNHDALALAVAETTEVTVEVWLDAGDCHGVGDCKVVTLRETALPACEGLPGEGDHVVNAEGRIELAFGQYHGDSAGARGGPHRRDVLPVEQ